MVYETIIPLSEETRIAIRNSDPSIHDLLKRDFHNQMNILVNLLREYEYEKEVKGVIRTVDITHLQLDSNGIGSFQVSYLTNIFNGCRDVDYDMTNTMKINFRIDLHNGDTFVKGEDSLPKRDPDEF